MVIERGWVRVVLEKVLWHRRERKRFSRSDGFPGDSQRQLHQTLGLIVGNHQSVLCRLSPKSLSSSYSGLNTSILCNLGRKGPQVPLLSRTTVGFFFFFFHQRVKRFRRKPSSTKVLYPLCLLVSKFQEWCTSLV